MLAFLLGAEEDTLREFAESSKSGRAAKATQCGEAVQMPGDVRPTVSRARYDVPVAAPFRLDLTVSVLRRLSTNVVDVVTTDGQYARALSGSHEPVVTRVTQVAPNTLAVTLEGNVRAHSRALAVVRRMLGVDYDLTPFDRAAAGISWLQPLAARMRGVKPPRYPTLWEACANAIVSQQLSLSAASAIMCRLVKDLGRPFDTEGVRLYAFPTAESVQRAEDRTLRAAGLSVGKLMTLRRVSEALIAGTLDEPMLEAQASPDAAALLRRIKGIGPWTAAVILLRGLGRLDVFPANDSSVARNLAMVAGATPPDFDAIIGTLRPQQGMLYYHLLLARLESQGEVGRPSAPRWPSMEGGAVREAT
jgi:DNA-3-methyladenine glycosylase II